MIASGSSERGLSEVTIRPVRQPRRDLAHQRPLAAVAVAAGAEHADHAVCLRSVARRAQHVLERVGRVGVVDEHGEVLALLDRLEATGTRPASGATGRRSRRSPQRAPTRRDAPATFATLKRPGSGGVRPRGAAGACGVKRRTAEAGATSAAR